MKKKTAPKLWRRKLTAAALGISLGLSAFMASVALAAPEIPIDTTNVDNYDGGRLPVGLDDSYYSYPQDTNGIMPFTLDSLSAKYDLRYDHDKTPVTSTKNQNPWAACWAFGTTSSIESNAIIAGAGTADSTDYSEHYLAWFVYQPYGGEGYEVVSGKDAVLNFGGSREMTTTNTASWSGPVDESLAKWQNAAGGLEAEGDWTLPDSLLEKVPEADKVRVQNVDYLPGTGIFTGETGYSFDEKALKAIKQSLMKNGVVDVSYYAGRNLPGEEEKPTEIFNVNTHAQYSPGRASANHEVSIVGWDDTYGVENFSTAPPAPGAWIVKNNWGTEDRTSVDENGYFHISYYDQTITDFTSFQVDVPDKNGLYSYDTNYQYDYLGMKSFVSVTPSQDNTGVKIANLFTAQKDSELEAVSVTTAEPDSQVKIEIYKLADGADVSQAGEPVYTLEETIAYGGYHTINLKAPIYLEAGERFVVAETITGASGGYLPIEVGSNKVIEQMGGSFRSVAKIDPGQSYVVSTNEDGSLLWDDIAEVPPIDGYNYGNAMIKAFTVDDDVAVAAALTVESLDGQKQSLGSQNITDFSSPILLPAGTESVRLSASAENGTASLNVAENTEISKDALNGIVLSTVSEPRGNNPAEYALNFEIKAVPGGGGGDPQISGDNTVKNTGTLVNNNTKTGLTGGNPMLIPVCVVVIALVIGGIWIYMRKRNNK